MSGTRRDPAIILGMQAAAGAWYALRYSHLGAGAPAWSTYAMAVVIGLGVVAWAEWRYPRKPPPPGERDDHTPAALHRRRC